VYYAVPARYRNAVALAGSLVFYAWGAPRFVFVLCVSSVIDYLLSHQLGPSHSSARRRGIITAAIAANLGVFFYAKYANFFVGEVNHLLGALGSGSVSWTNIALPIGISFFTFQKLSYLVDVYRGVVAPARSLSTYVLYVSLFPQLIAGPIVRYHDVNKQLESRTLTSDKMLEGIWRFCVGLGKKVLVANVLAEVADYAFGMKVTELTAAQAWIGIFCYSFQIYFDFSGYSDMAIGLGHMLGFRFLENFDHPYISRTFTEFWHRWHISLSNWMREYLYVPLGGNRRGRGRTYFNLWVVFLLSGLWHGAAWNFIAWGAFHGLFLCLDKLTGFSRRRVMPAFVGIPLTFCLVTVGWVFFRANDLSHAMQYLGRMFLLSTVSQDSTTLTLAQFIDLRALVVLVIAIVLSFLPVWSGLTDTLKHRFSADTALCVLLRYGSALTLLLLSAMALASGQFNPFIYFRF
jgi:alginate O-acetyltransferase complex protein AlgI